MPRFFLILILHVILHQGVSSQTKIKISKPSENAPVISKHIYGHFAEHLGRCIYDGLYIGDNSRIPNTNGVRNDIIKALKDLKKNNKMSEDELFTAQDEVKKLLDRYIEKTDKILATKEKEIMEI